MKSPIIVIPKVEWYIKYYKIHLISRNPGKIEELIVYTTRHIGRNNVPIAEAIIHMGAYNKYPFS